MSNENEAQKRLTLEDPVDPAILTQLEMLHGHWMDLAERNTRLDQEKIQILAALKRIDDERHRIFESIQVERGISPARRVTIDPKSRIIKVLDGNEKPEPVPEPKEQKPAE